MKKVYIIAAILALITGIVSYSYLQSLEAMAKKDYVNVVVAAYDIPSQTVITADMLTVKKVSSDSKHPLAAKSINDVVGMVASSNIVKDEQVLTSRLIKLGENKGGFSYIIPDGMRAFTLAVDGVSGVAGFIRPGDHVDIVVSMVFTETGDNSKENQSFIAFQNIEVLAVGSIAKGTKTKDAVEYGTVTLAINTDDCAKLNMFAIQGKMRMLLRSPADKNTAEYAVVSPSNFQD